ncbi:MAG: Hsp70 family protein [Desulfuromonas sp.]|nr:Hsp70 family protein [Desulfuromonas sp.]
MSENSKTTTNSRYAIGIDLGTTNCALSFVDYKQPHLGSQVLPLTQWDSAGSTVQHDTMPSFAYAPTSGELHRFSADNNTIPAPHHGWIPGLHARNQMAINPGRVILSAKSWLCHNDIDRTSAILPWQSQDIPDELKLSPVQASATYLRWIKDVWQQRMLIDHPDAEFDHQDIVITVPASFDEAAQELTLLAAHQAGYPDNLRLIEEPQAAFYFWLGKDQHLSQLHTLLQQHENASINILVCDIGGGTTDLSLFAATSDKKSLTGLTLKRLAVSDHLLLGGDNIDLALAALIEHKLTQGKKRLTGRQYNQLLVQARELKERILGSEEEISDVADDREFTITLSGSGAGMFASTISTAISASEIKHCVVEGFFPLCTANDRPQQRTAALKEWGLPYAADSAVSHHLAAFLNNQRVDAVLFNGGSVTPLLLRQRLHQLICSWHSQHQPVVLHNEAISMAVARGAARYGWIVNQNAAEHKISGGHAHALYLEVSKGKRRQERSLVCILPQGMEAGTTIRIDKAEFDLIVNQPARFQCCYSVRRKQDRAGDIIAWNKQDFHFLPPLETAIHLKQGQSVANNRLRVRLEATLNELGLLQLYCVAAQGEGQWRLDFNLRKGVELSSDAQTTPAPESRQVSPAAELLRAVFAKKRDPQLPEIKPRQLVKHIEQQLGARDTWDSLTLRAMWPELAAGMTRKTRSIEHEAAWLYLAGFTLRPGYGVQLDESRVEELWRLFSLGVSFPKEKRVQSQWYILWRRVAGGLNRARQLQLLDKIDPIIRSGNTSVPEIIYLAGALERIPAQTKVELVQLFTTTLLRQQLRHKAPYMWALGRLLSRAPLYADASTIIHPRQVEILFNKVQAFDWSSPEWRGLTNLFALAARCTEQRDIDVAHPVRQEIGAKMRTAKCPIDQIQPVEKFVAISHNDREIHFGETLPAGLILVNHS